LSFSFCLGHTIVSRIIPEVCDALWSALQDYMRQP